MIGVIESIDDEFSDDCRSMPSVTSSKSGVRAMSNYADVVASGAEGQANLNIWMQDITPWFPGCHRTVMKRQLILAVREFFEQSWAWRATSRGRSR